MFQGDVYLSFHLSKTKLGYYHNPHFSWFYPFIVKQVAPKSSCNMYSIFNCKISSMTGIGSDVRKTNSTQSNKISKGASGLNCSSTSNKVASNVSEGVTFTVLLSLTYRLVIPTCTASLFCETPYPIRLSLNS